MKKNKILAFLLVLIMLLSMVAACAEKPVAEEPAEESSEEAVAEESGEEEVSEEQSDGVADQVILAIGGDPGDLGPFVGMSMGRIAVLHTMYEYLFDLEVAGEPLTPYIAQSWEETGDKTYTVTLFENVYDSAGNHITAADVAWSYTTAVESGNLRPLGDVESVTATGDYTVDFVLKVEPGMGTVEKILCEAPIVSQAAFEASDDQFSTKPVTTSPYVVAEYVPGSSITFERRDDYWQTDLSQGPKYNQSNVQTIVMQVITEPAQHAIALETGSAHISGSISSDDVANFKDQAGFSLYTFQDNLSQVLIFNGSEGNVFSSKEVRQAVSYAIDTDAMCAAVSPGACTALSTIGNSNFGGYMSKWEDENYYDFDVDMAKELVASAGLGEATVQMLALNDSRTGLMAQIIQNQLAELGITVEINQVESSVFEQLKLDSTAWDLMLDQAAGGDYIFSPSQLIFDQNRNNGATSGFVVDDELQALLDTAASEFTDESIETFHAYQKEQVYAYGLISFHNIVVAIEGVTNVERDGRGQVVPGVCEYAPDF